MPAERFYINNPTLHPSEILTLDNEEFHHLSRVMRIREGETVELINGRGYLAKAQVHTLEKKHAKLTVVSVQRSPAPSRRLILAQGLPKASKLEWIVEKAVELGATDLWIFPSHLSEKKQLSESQIARLHTIIISAMKQCGRLSIPNLEIKPPLLKWDKLSENLQGFFGDTSGLAKHLITLCPKDSDTLLAIGPEKGFHSKETQYLVDFLGCKAAKLHANILRTETASLCGLSILSTFN